MSNCDRLELENTLVLESPVMELTGEGTMKIEDEAQETHALNLCFLLRIRIHALGLKNHYL